MPVSLCQWRVRIGTFVHWIRDYEIKERKERLLKERTRRVKVLCERLKAKMSDTEQDSEDDDKNAGESRQDGSSSMKRQKCSHKTTNIHSSENSSYIKDLLTSCDQCIQDLLTQNYTHINEVLTQPDISVQQLLAQNDLYLKDLLSRKLQHTALGTSFKELSHNDSKIRKLVTQSESYIKELINTVDSGKNDMILSTEFCRNDQPVQSDSTANNLFSQADFDSRIPLVPSNLQTQLDSYVRDLLRPSDTSISELLTARDSSVKDLLTPSNYSTDDFPTLRDSSNKDSRTPRDNRINELLTASDTSITELLTQDDALINELLTPGDYSFYEVLTPSDSSLGESSSFPEDSSINDLLTPKDSSVNQLLMPRELSLRELPPPRDSSSNEFLMPKDSSLNELLSPTDASMNELLNHIDSPVNELLIPRHFPIDASLTPGDSYTCRLLTPREPVLPISGVEFHEPVKNVRKEVNEDQKELESSYAFEKGQLIGVGSGAPLEGIKHDDSPWHRPRFPLSTSTLDSNVTQNGFQKAKDISNESSDSSAWTLEATDDGITPYNPCIAELLLAKAGDVELNPGPLHGSRSDEIGDQELINLACDVSPSKYTNLCNALGVTYKQSKAILDRNLMDVTRSMTEVLFEWKKRQVDGTDCRQAIAEVLRRAELDALCDKLSRAAYSPQEPAPDEGCELFLWKICEKLDYSQCQILGRKLGLHQATLQNIYAKNQRGMSSQEEVTFEILHKWKANQTPDDNPLGKLQEILVNDLQFSKDDVQNIFQEENLLHESATGRSLGDLQLHLISEKVDKDQYIPLILRLGLTFTELQVSRQNHGGDAVRSLFEMLCRWQKSLSPEIDQIQSMCNILRSCGQKMLAQNIGTYSSRESIPTGDGMQPLTREQVTRCGEDFKTFYQTRLCRIKTDPLDFNSILEFERIYTNLELLRNKMGTTRTPLDYKNLLTTEVNGKLLKRLMVEGEGGAGKTTFCSKIAWDWTNGVDQFKEFDWVLVIPLRDIETDQTIGEIAKTYLSEDNSVQPCQINKYILANPSKVFIIFDGLDEYDYDLVKQGTDIAKIIRSEKYKECMVLVTTRPWKAHQIKLNFTFIRAYAFIAVTGFDKENVSIYINKYFSDDPQAGQDLIGLIESNDVIKENMAPYPIYIAMLCVLWRDSDSEKRQLIRRLKTFSQLFQEIITFLRDHYVSKQYTDLNKDESVTQTYKELDIYFTQIGKIALSGVMDKKLVFGKDDFSECEVAMETCCRVGVLSQEKRLVRRRDRPRNVTQPVISSVFFPHKLFQEYLAGVYLAYLFESDHESYKVKINYLFQKGLEEFRYLLYFTASQSKDVGLDITNRLMRMKEIDNYDNEYDAGILVDVTFEAFDEEVAKEVGNQTFSQKRALEISDRMSAHTVSGYLFIMEMKAMVRS